MMNMELMNKIVQRKKEYDEKIKQVQDNKQITVSLDNMYFAYKHFRIVYVQDRERRENPVPAKRFDWRKLQ